jgi:hypothetical protein
MNWYMLGEIEQRWYQVSITTHFVKNEVFKKKEAGYRHRNVVRDTSLMVKIAEDCLVLRLENSLPLYQLLTTSEDISIRILFKDQFSIICNNDTVCVVENLDIKNIIFVESTGDLILMLNFNAEKAI